MPSDIFISYVALIAAGFLMGGIMFCELIPLLATGKDISKLSDDNNPGAANAFIHCGVKIGLICLICDLLKGFLPVYIAINFLPTDNLLFSLVMLAPVLGHAIGIFNGFSGGKCIATSFGIVIASLNISATGLILAFLYIFIVVVFKTDHRTGSIIVFALFGLSTVIIGLLIGQAFLGIGFALVSVTAIIKHLHKPDKKFVGETGDVAIKNGENVCENAANAR